MYFGHLGPFFFFLTVLIRVWHRHPEDGERQGKPLDADLVYF